jgi:undecaprenyl-diphosphatase
VIDGITVLAGFVSFLTGLLTMAIMMAWLQRRAFMPFALYRVLIGAGILALAYGWVSL